MVNTVRPRLIHLLYVPTLSCNLNCSYCYLEDMMHKKDVGANGADGKNYSELETLRFAVAKFQESGVVPFNISLHGGEVTILKETVLEELFQFIIAYYEERKQLLSANGFTKKEPHIKTNLYNFDKLLGLFNQYHVSISGSIDLPLSMHDRYRLTKTGSSTLEKTMQNLGLLSQYPYRKKFSTVIYYEHYRRIEELIRDIWKIHREIGFDMNNFNFMFGFETRQHASKRLLEDKTDLRPLTDEEQVDFFHRMRQEFAGTELDRGLNKMWFEEFTPSYCTNSLNCGEKFFLLQFNGDIYSCVRGQSRQEFYFGNIFRDTVEQILQNGYARINLAHINAGLDSKCMECEYLGLCKTGCPFVKFEQNIAGSYTCELQKCIYRQFPKEYKPFQNVGEKREFLDLFLAMSHPQKAFEEIPGTKGEGKMILSSDFYDKKNALSVIIKNDPILDRIYSVNNIFFQVDGQNTALESQILKTNRQILFLRPQNSVKILIQKNLFQVYCDELVRNSLYLMCLRDTKVSYGDEQRVKQEHLFTYQIYYNMLESEQENSGESFAVDITELLAYHSKWFLKGVLNNLFVTTSFMRDYHYQKQKDNAFYHIQAINLPFPNIEFYWDQQ